MLLKSVYSDKFEYLPTPILNFLLKVPLSHVSGSDDHVLACTQRH